MNYFIQFLPHCLGSLVFLTLKCHQFFYKTDMLISRWEEENTHGGKEPRGVKRGA